jgi:hypothetical protein
VTHKIRLTFRGFKEERKRKKKDETKGRHKNAKDASLHLKPLRSKRKG